MGWRQNWAGVSSGVRDGVWADFTGVSSGFGDGESVVSGKAGGSSGVR